MCHLCRKVARLQSVDSGAKKPIYTLLARIHKNNEHRLGDYWLIRHEHLITLKKLLSGLPQIRPVKGLLEQVELDMQHVKRSMPSHPVRYGRGVLDDLKSNLAPSDSVSVEMRKERENLGLVGEGRMEKAVRVARGSKKAEEDAELEEKEGSDIDPPQAVIQRSVEKVRAWLDENTKTISDAGWRENDNLPLVDVADGTVVVRPKVDNALVWKAAHSQRDKTPAKVDGRSKSSLQPVRVDRNRSYKVPVTQISNCVYNKPDIRPKLGDIRRLAVLDGSEREQMDSTTSFQLDHRKADKLSKHRNISITEAILVLQENEQKNKEKTLMSGGRSPGNRVPAESIRRLIEYRDRSNVTKQKERDAREELEWDSIESMSWMSSTSSRSSYSLTRDGSPAPRSISHHTASSETTWTKASKKQDQMPSGGPVKTSEAVERMPNLRSREGISRMKTTHPLNKPLPPLPVDQAQLKPRTSSAHDISENSGISEAVKNSRRRRRERAELGTPFLDNYRNEERSRIWEKENI